MLAAKAITAEALAGGGEYIGLRAATQRYPGLAYSTLRGYIHSGRLKALRGPGDRIWIKATDLETLYTPIAPKPGPQQKD